MNYRTNVYVAFNSDDINNGGRGFSLTYKDAGKQAVFFFIKHFQFSMFVFQIFRLFLPAA